MARPHSVQHSDAHATDPSPADWQALRGELVALLDQVGGHHRDEPPDPAYDSFAQRMRDLREQVVEVPPDDRRREALRSVKRQVERFHDREDHDDPRPFGPASLPGRENVLSAAIAQIRERTQMTAPAPVPPAAGSPDALAGPQMTQVMDTLTARLEQLEAELRAQAGNAVHVQEIAEQVSQLSHVVELLAGAIGETGQVKRLEGQLAELAHMVAQAPRIDFGVVTDRLDDLTATVERLADLQVQQVQHAVLEAEAGGGEGNAAQSLRAIEASIRSIYDRIDAIEQSNPSPLPQLERLTEILTELTTRIGAETARPERLLGLVDALNARITDIEGKGEHVTALKADIAGLRTAVLTAVEPRFTAIETQLGALGEKLQAVPETPPALAQIEAQMRLLLARIDQTGEQIDGLTRRQAETPGPVAPDFEALANLAATRSLEAMRAGQPELAPAPTPDFAALADLAATRAAEAVEARRIETPSAPAADFEAIAEMLAARASEAVARAIPPVPDLNALAAVAAARASVAVAERVPPAPDMAAFAELVAERTGAIIAEKQLPAPDFEALAALAATQASEATANRAAVAPRIDESQLAEIEQRISHLVQNFLSARAPDDFSAMQHGIRQVDERLARLEMALAPRVPDALPMVPPPAVSSAAPLAAPAPEPIAAAAPTEFLPVAEAKPQPTTRADDPVRDRMPRNPGVEAPLREFGFPDLSPVAAAIESRTGRSAAALAFETPSVREPAPTAPDLTDDSLLFSQPAEVPKDAPAEPVTPSSRNTFIEAARRAAQRQNATKPVNDPNSLIGRALARFQPGPGGKSTAADGAADPAAEPVPDVPPAKAIKPVKAKRLGRRDAPVPDAAGLPAGLVSVEPGPDVVEMLAADRRATRKESFLLRHRRPILIAASLVAISFMTLNLVMQRLNATDPASPTAKLAATAAPPAARTGTTPTDTATTPAPPTPAAKPADASASAAAKPMSAIAPAAPATAAVASAAPAAGTPAATAGTDPTTTGAVGSGPELDYATNDYTMPPALQAANAAATAATGTGAQPVGLASADADAATPAPADSPVKVDLPPDSLGPLDLRQAAANGDARAQFEIGAIYQEGRAVPQDLGQAEVWYERAAAQGFTPAQYRLGNLYETGKGVDKDMEQARLWYQRAAEAGNRMAMHNLASLYAGGAFGKQDFAAAAEWFERAANLGLKDSQFNLGMLYSRGLGVPQDMAASYKWFALAATSGDTDAAKARDNIAKSLDPDMLKTASADVAAWKPQAIDLAANFAPLGTWTTNFDPGQAITDKTVVAKVQLALARLGFDIGTPDGHLGPKTTDAIKAFERGTGMTEVGAINPRLLAVLGSQPV